MNVTLKKQYRGVEITVIGNENEDVVQKLADIMGKFDYEDVGQLEPEVQPKSETSTTHASLNLEHLVAIEDDGPKILTPLLSQVTNKKLLRETQAKAFMVLAFVLKNRYNKTELTSNQITEFMKASGVATTNIHNTTVYLSKECLISRSKGEKAFKITAKGEEYARQLLEDAGNALRG